MYRQIAIKVTVHVPSNSHILYLALTDPGLSRVKFTWYKRGFFWDDLYYVLRPASGRSLLHSLLSAEEGWGVSIRPLLSNYRTVLSSLCTVFDLYQTLHWCIIQIFLLFNKSILLITILDIVVIRAFKFGDLNIFLSCFQAQGPRYRAK